MGFREYKRMRRLNILVLIEIILLYASELFRGHRKTRIQRSNLWHVSSANDFEKVYQNYISHLNEALKSRNFTNKRIIVADVGKNELSGLGNRLPILAASFLWAILTNSIFLINSENFYKHFNPQDLPNLDIGHYIHDLKSQNLPAELVWECDYNLFDTLLTKNLTTALPENRLIKFRCLDFPMLPLYSNPLYKIQLKKMFPSYTSFYQLSQKLFPIHDSIKKPVDQYWTTHLKRFKAVIGVHMRRLKYVPGRNTLDIKQFAALITLIRETKYSKIPMVAVFIATDDIKGRDSLKHALQGRGLRVFTQTGNFLLDTTRAGNPGTEESALFDLSILSKCDQLVYTFSSSFGGIAAGLGNIPSYIINHEKTANEADDSWYTKSLTSEPCFYHARRYLQHSKNTEALKQSPIWMEQSQCHYYV